MLPDFRFVIGASLAIAVLIVAAFGLATSLRLAREAKVGPLEANRTLAFTDRAERTETHLPDGLAALDSATRSADTAAAGAPTGLAPGAGDQAAPDGAAQDVAAPVAAAPDRDQRTPAAATEAQAVDAPPIDLRPPETTSAQQPEAPGAAVTGATEAGAIGTAETAAAARATADAPPAGAEVEHVASLPSTSAESQAPQANQVPIPRKAAPLRPQVRKVLPRAKRVVRVARVRRHRVRLVQQPVAQTGYLLPLPETTTKPTRAIRTTRTTKIKDPNASSIFGDWPGANE